MSNMKISRRIHFRRLVKYIRIFLNDSIFMFIYQILFIFKGLNDNGSGVTVLLEIVNSLMKSKCYVNSHSVLFVLFDAEETGRFLKG